MRARQPIEQLLADEQTDPELRQKLQTLQQARAFATANLLLPENDSYSSYVETGRTAVTWNVVAAGEFSLSPLTWCFPVAGCVSYRGYFDKMDAEHYAATLKRKHYDVSVGGATAYSTLGWFDDPVLDTMLRGGDTRYVGTLFHELAHQVLYVKDDSNFNEAFATFVERIGVRAWLASRQESERIAAYDASQQRVEDFVHLLRQSRDSLQSLYEQELPAAEMRQAKQRVFEDLRSRYQSLKQSWGGFTGYDNWFRRELNNARLVAVSTYRRNVPAFQAMYKQVDQDMAAFYELAREVADLPFAERQQRLEDYLSEASGD
ncbi:MAG: aminopeptidase [Granulosicoccus sp.]|nr:aminopeptidase [Granulosicoccus sp.]